MPKKIVLTVGLLVLLPILIVVASWPEAARRAGASWPDASSFTTPYNISNSTQPQYYNSQHPRIVHAPDNYLHVVWMEGTDGGYGAAYTKGQGTTWNLWEWIYPTLNPAYANPALALDNQGTLHAVWTSNASSPYDILYASKPVGGSWSAPVNLSQAIGPRLSSFYPGIGVDSTGRVWAAWQTGVTDTNSDIWARSRPAGGDWTTPLKVSASDKQDLNVVLYVGAGDVPHLVWRSNSTGTYDIFYSKFTGGSWTFPLNVSGTGSHSYWPGISGDNQGNLFVVWTDEINGSGSFDILFRRWDGSQWLPWVHASHSPKALYPAISADGCLLYVTWQDYRDDPARTETYFTHSTNCGTSWLGDENVSRNSTSSYYPQVAAQSGGLAHIVWQDMAPGQLDIFYSKAVIEGGGITPTPVSPTPAVPYGAVNVVALQPPGNQDYTRQAAVQLNLVATSPAGHSLLMRYDNDAGFSGHPNYVAFASTVPSWSLATTPNSCVEKTVYAQFKDSVDNTESIVYSDPIFYDDWLTATLVLNGGNAYTNRMMVKVDTEDRDRQVGCSGLYAMQFQEEGITYTGWYSYLLPGLWIYLQPSGPSTRVIHGNFLDRAGNERSFSDQITFDMNPPLNGSSPAMPASTTDLVIEVANLQATDGESGVGYVWLANNCTLPGEGSWAALAYCSSPPCSYDWNLAYGGPPVLAPGLHKVCVKYEDKSGYGSFRGNFSSITSGTLTVTGIRTAFLPLITRGKKGLQAYAPPAAPAAAGLTLFADPPRAGPGQDVLLYLFAPPQPGAAAEGTLQIELPVGLRVVRAWSAYGELLQVGPYQVRSREHTSAPQGAWITVLARVEPGAAPLLQVQGDLVWNEGVLTSIPVWVENR